MGLKPRLAFTLGLSVKACDPDLITALVALNPHPLTWHSLLGAHFRVSLDRLSVSVGCQPDAEG